MLSPRLRRTTGDIWPIDPSKSQQPDGWPGWPNGKKLDVVQTHDVEGPGGLVRCRELAEQERKLGLRSSFNFIPDGSYPPDPDVRAGLNRNGFGAGVQDLQHDGHLISSQAELDLKAERIDHHLRDRSANEFRARFVLRNLDWPHELDIAYVSPFETDPFDPQPESACTIFSVSVPAPSANGSGKDRGDVAFAPVRRVFCLPIIALLFVTFEAHKCRLLVMPTAAVVVWSLTRWFRAFERLVALDRLPPTILPSQSAETRHKGPVAQPVPRTGQAPGLSASRRTSASRSRSQFELA